MKKYILPAFLILGLMAPAVSTSAAEGAAAAKPAAKKAASEVATEMGAIVKKIQAKLKDGKKAEGDFTAELKEFDDLIAKHKDEKSDDVAQVLYMKAMLFTQVLNDEAKGEALLAQLKKDFPETRQAKMIAKQEESEKIKRSLKVGAKFPEFDEKDVDGKSFSLAGYKGKVVLVDFWATWCGPCVKELPNVLAAYEKHHKSGFEIAGISLDQDETKLRDFTKKENMPWQQFFDGKGWNNKLAGKYGVNSIPATYLLDGTGTIIGKDLRGPALEKAVAEALAKK